MRLVGEKQNSNGTGRLGAGGQLTGHWPALGTTRCERGSRCRATAAGSGLIPECGTLPEFLDADLFLNRLPKPTAFRGEEEGEKKKEDEGRPVQFRE